MQTTSVLDRRETEEILTAITKVIGEDDNQDISLLGGKTGHILYLAYLSRFLQQPDYLNDAVDIINECIDYVASNPHHFAQIYSYSGGLVGFAWVIRHLIREGYLPADTEEVLEGIDAFTLEYLQKDIDTKHYDSLHGFVGKGIYFLESYPAQVAQQGLAMIVEALEQQKTLFGQDASWPSHQPDMPQDGIRCDCGLAHGVSGILVLLSRIHQLGYMTQRVEALLATGTQWMLQFQSPTVWATGYVFPDFVTYYPSRDPVASPTSRLGWCYGDLAVSMALLQVGKTGSNSAAEASARRVTQWHAAQSQDFAQVMRQDDRPDTSFCHGALGIAHLYAALDAHLKIPALADAANQWLAIGLPEVKCCLKDGSLQSEYDGKLQDTGILYGYSGIGLVLMGFVNPAFRAWQRSLLIY